MFHNDSNVIFGVIVGPYGNMGCAEFNGGAKN